jgi:hypothetical protein
MLVSEWPAGIDVEGRFLRWKLRGCGPIFKEPIEKLAAESDDVSASTLRSTLSRISGRFLPQCNPGRPLLDRLARLCVRHFRPELIREHEYLRMAARRSLLSA